MATRIIIMSDNGTPLVALDGHHGTAQAAAWLDAMLAQIGSQCIAVELVPERGGDDVRRGVCGALDRMQLDIHALPDGTREIIGLALRHDNGMPEAVRGGLRILHAPADIIGERHTMAQRATRLSPSVETR